MRHSLHVAIIDMFKRLGFAQLAGGSFTSGGYSNHVVHARVFTNEVRLTYKHDTDDALVEQVVMPCKAGRTAVDVENFIVETLELSNNLHSA